MLMKFLKTGNLVLLGKIFPHFFINFVLMPDMGNIILREV
jgi:hypothetical protein